MLILLLCCSMCLCVRYNSFIRCCNAQIRGWMTFLLPSTTASSSRFHWKTPLARFTCTNINDACTNTHMIKYSNEFFLLPFCHHSYCICRKERKKEKKCIYKWNKIDCVLLLFTTAVAFVHMIFPHVGRSFGWTCEWGGGEKEKEMMKTKNHISHQLAYGQNAH